MFEYIIVGTRLAGSVIPKKENSKLYERYQKKVDNFKNIIFLGRLAEYKYYDMVVLE